MIQRRAFLSGLVSALAAPAIVRASVLMPVRGLVMAAPGQIFDPLQWRPGEFEAVLNYGLVSWMP